MLSKNPLMSASTTRRYRPNCNLMVSLSTPYAAFFRIRCQQRYNIGPLIIRYRSRNRCLFSLLAFLAIPGSEVGRRRSSLCCPAPVSFAGYGLLSAPSPCKRLSRSPSTTSGSDFLHILGSPYFGRGRLPASSFHGLPSSV